MAVSVAQLRAFLAVVDCRSFSAAGDELGISQSAISHAIHGLERDLGGHVIDRAGEIRVTSLGEVVMPYARSALATLDSLQSSVRAFRGDLAGTVRLAAVPTVCQGLVPGLLQLWKARLPDVDVRIFEGDDDEMGEWLESGMVDAAILIDSADAGPDSLIVAQDDFRAVLRRDHPLAGQDVVPVHELHEDGFIVSTGGCAAHVQRIHALAGVPFETQQRVRELATLLSMVQQGIGVSIMPSLGESMLPDSLVMRPITPTVQRTLVLSGPRSRAWHPLTHALIEVLRDRPSVGNAA
ncbi:LysR family transcriptional regulator [Saxibacter everestensis]|uniref:LysR family transcriptional regulator n=1 Tax=Saxibacter everestensis TaxID=2909229 RepID=A0ABY8QQM1_9MICO|nr:LysR family transcriptional regulator [Brevibacteriaceae bacterium ZFBP1038]